MRTKKESHNGIILIYIILIFSTIIAPTFMILNKDSMYTMFVRPITWIVLFFLCIILTLNEYSRLGKKKEIAKSILIVTGLYLILYYLLGIVVGFQYSPFSHTIKGILTNFWSMVLIIILQEYVRASLVDNCGKSKLMYFIITILFVLVGINWKECVENFSNLTDAFKYLASTLTPLIVTNALCTYVACYIGYFANILYRVPIMLAMILTPIVPNLDWFISGVFEIIIAYVLFLVTNHEFNTEIKRERRARKKDESIIKNIPFVLVLVFLVLFVAGVFEYMPVAILSNSMKPQFSRGDVVIVEKIKDDEYKTLQVGDIVEYVLDRKIVVHRIFKIINPEKGIYITKGDNNNAPDVRKVTKDQIVGKVDIYIPYIGYPSVWLSQIVNTSAPVDIETGN